MEAVRADATPSEVGSTTDDYVTPAEEIETPTPRVEQKIKSNGFPFPVTSLNGNAAAQTIADAPNVPDTSPTMQRSVQFPSVPEAAAGDQLSNAPAAPHHTPGHQSRGSKLKDKLRELKTATTASPPKSKSFDKKSLPLDAGDEHDADAEESGRETPGTSNMASRPRRLVTDLRPATTITAPSSPLISRDLEPTGAISPRPIRRSTAPEGEHQGLSEDEGRARLSKSPGWRMQSSQWFHSHGSPSQATDDGAINDSSGHQKSRPRNLKRLSHMGRTPTSSGPMTPRRADFGPKWRQVKAGLKAISQKKRAEKVSIDQIKSTELMAELLAGSPAALILASRFLRDEHEKRKIPVLLEQLKVNVVDSRERNESAGDRHVNFRIELEYGNGLMRKKWVIWRRLGDFVSLHTKYKLEAASHKYRVTRPDGTTKSRLPRFPRSAFPYLRAVRGLADESDEEEEKQLTDNSVSQDPPLSTPRLNKRRQSSNILRRRSTTGDNDTHDQQTNSANARELYAERQRKKLEQYLREMIRYQMFRAGSNRLCKFLELSALGIRLASEGGYQGKEGTLLLQSGSGTDWRRAWNPALLAKRHKPMWFLVRSSYIACVDSPEAMNIYDCFLVDPYFSIQSKRPRIRDQKGAKDIARTARNSAAHPQHHTIKIFNSERRLKLLVKNSALLQQWQESIEFMAKTTEWSKKHRFDSFAPVRQNVYAQWLVDGRDYMWNVSRAISQAHDVIYIHDWWLSPELYLRRPAAISQKWRLDRLLKRKAEEGVKIFVIMYRNIDAAIPIDSEYSKFSLLDLHPNVFVQRSPNQVRQNVFFWSHHEKVCVIDHSIAFCGGVDLCFGRWDTPSHSVIDDKPTGFEPTDGPKNADNCQLWPGKDYSNPRVLDFFKLDDPYGEMYDRSRVPRMPWHDIGMQIVGQPARDLTRHFVQRWNYILRQRTPTRPTPFLLPPSDFTDADLEAMGIDGTCEIQILRSCGEWSMGTPGRTEHSIQNAYVKLISESEHFIYLENQFFITSCTVEGTQIHNQIGDALVDRIIRANEDGEDWLAIMVVPLMPGYANAVDEQDGTSVRLIMQCQYRSICRGSSSIFERLRHVGIDPEDYIRFYGLRQWGRVGPTRALVTEQLYIHAKCMVVDDRYAIIGSANINERSLLGHRDSEIASLIFDKDMIDSRMANKDYKVGRFPHTLRMRLMREHLGVDVDTIMDDERQGQYDHEDASFDDDYHTDASSVISSQSGVQRALESRHKIQDALIARSDEIHTFNHDADAEQVQSSRTTRHKKVTTDSRVTNNKKHEEDVDGYGFDNMASPDQQATLDGRDSRLLKGNREVLLASVDTEGKGTLAKPLKQKSESPDKSSVSHEDDNALSSEAPLPPWPTKRMDTQQLGLPTLSLMPTLPVSDDTAFGGPPLQKTSTRGSGASAINPLLSSMRRPVVDKDCMRDPLNEYFYQGTWHAVAQNNTRLYRQVFRCQPDNEVAIWGQYHAWNEYAKRFKAAQGMSQDENEVKGQKAKTGPPGTGTGVSKVADALSRMVESNDAAKEEAQRGKADHLSRPTTVDTTDTAETERLAQEAQDEHRTAAQKDFTGHDRTELDEKNGTSKHDGSAAAAAAAGAASFEAAKNVKARRRRGTTRSRGNFSGSEPVLNKADAEELMKLVQGNIVEWPYDWLAQEERGGKWLYTVDQMAPIEIYN